MLVTIAQDAGIVIAGFLLATMGILAVVMCVWLWVELIRGILTGIEMRRDAKKWLEKHRNDPML